MHRPPRDQLRISQRLLWVNGAAYPLENITRVYTFVLTPRRGEAFLQFLKRGGATIALILVLMLLGNVSGGSSSSAWDSSSSSSDSDGVFRILVVLAVLLFLYFLGDMASVVFASSHYTLAIETNGRSTALVGGDPAHLDRLVVSIAATIDQPDAYLEVRVESLAITNYGNYHFGDSVNIYGGSGHTGVLK